MSSVVKPISGIFDGESPERSSCRRSSRGTKRCRVEIQPLFLNAAAKETEVPHSSEYYMGAGVEEMVVDECWTVGELQSPTSRQLRAVRSDGSLQPALALNADFEGNTSDGGLLPSMKSINSMTSLLWPDDLLCATTSDQQFDFADAIAARQWLSQECTTTHFSVILEKKDSDHPEEFKITMHWTAEGRAVLAAANESLSTIIDQELKGTRRPHKKYLCRIRFALMTDGIDDTRQKTQERIENCRRVQEFCQFLKRFVELSRDERSDALKDIDNVISTALLAPKGNGYRMRSHNIMQALFEFVDRTQSEHGAAILLGFAGGGDGRGANPGSNRRSESSGHSPSGTNDSESGDGSRETSGGEEPGGGGNGGGDTAGGGRDDDENSHHSSEVGEGRGSDYDSNSTSDGRSGSSEDDDAREVEAMQAGLPGYLAPVRERVLRVAAERRQVIVRDIEAFFVTQQTDGAVDAFEGNVHAMVAAAGADLVAVSQNMISMRPVVALEIRRMAEGARAEYQQRKATRARADSNAE